jgi:hydroxymethylpyrimidine pyrophosphatase-like HAD family hydrolase
MFPKLIAIDMDGTLLNSDGRVSARNLAALKFAESAGVEVVIATGRRHCYAMRVLRPLHLEPDAALVSSNGTVLRTIGSELMHRTHLPLETARWLCRHLAGFRNTLMLTFDTVTADGEDTRGALVCEHLDQLHLSIGRWMRSNEPYIQQVAHLEDALRDGNANGAPIQAMLCGPVDRMAAAEARLLEDYRVTAVGEPERPGATITLHRTIYPEKDLCIVDILPAGCSKASALQRLVHMRGLSMRDVLAIGDNWNDLPMLQHAGYAALMANAPTDLHALAHQNGWTIVPTNDEDGVAIAIEASLEPALTWSGS